MWKGARYKYWAWLIVAAFLLVVAKCSYAAGVQGLTYRTWASWGGAPAIPNTPPLTTGVVGNVNFQWGGGWVLDTQRGDGVIINFSGYYKVPGTGLQTFYFGIDSDDGQKLSVNNTLLVNCWCDQGQGFRYGAINLQGGSVVPIDVWFYENGGGAFVTLWWYNPAYGWEIIPASNFATDAAYFDPTVTITGGSSNITQAQLNTVTQSQSRRDAIALGNRIDIEERVGSSGNYVAIEQVGNWNRIQGVGGGNALIDGDNNWFNIKQGDTLTGRNLVELGVYGNSNNVTIWQSRHLSSGLQTTLDSGGHYAGLIVTGSSNTITMKQLNEGGSNSGHFGLLSVTGNSNYMTLRQASNNEKRAFISVDGSYNTSSVYQYGTGNHYVDITLTGIGHTANVTQSGSATQRATINLQNLGGSTTLNLNQQGSTGQQYSIIQQCANLNGCSVSVSQGGP